MEHLTRHALATATGVLAAALGAFFLGFDQPYWAAISALIISNTDRSALVTKGVLRIVGTIVGVSAGYTVAVQVEGAPLFQAPLLILSAAVGAYARQRATYAYAWFYGAVTFMLMILCSMTTPSELNTVAWFRMYEIILGVTAATLAHAALGPPAGSVRLIAGAAALPPAEAMRQSISAGIGVFAIVMFWDLFDLPSVIQVVVSSLVVLDATVGATRRRGWQRVLGCAIGGAYGLAAIAVTGPHLLMWCGALFGGLYLSARVHLGGSANAYIGTQSALALIVTMVDASPPDSIMPALNRLIGIIVGVSIMSLVVWALQSRAPRETASDAMPNTG